MSRRSNVAFVVRVVYVMIAEKALDGCERPRPASLASVDEGRLEGGGKI